MRNKMFQSELFDKVLIDPAVNGANELYVVSGYASSSMVTRHFEILRSKKLENITLDLTVGMTSRDGVALSSLIGFQNLGRQLSGSTAKCRFVTGAPVHSKVYVWCNEQGPVQAFTGSANYTQTGFGISAGASQIETCVEVDPVVAFNFVIERSSETISCHDPDIRKYLDVIEDPELEVSEPSHFVQTITDFIESSESVFLPLVQVKKAPGKVHNAGAGLNWGHRGKRNRDEAYLPIPSSARKIGFFPNKETHFQLLTDDGDSFSATVVQGGDKALVSTENNALLGRYFRRKLQLPPGTFIENDHLNNFGSNCVRISKVNEDTYFMSFTPGMIYTPTTADLTD